MSNEDVLDIKSAINNIGKARYTIKWDSNKLDQFLLALDRENLFDGSYELRNDAYVFGAGEYACYDTEIQKNDPYGIYIGVLNSVIQSVKSGLLPLFTWEGNYPSIITGKVLEPLHALYFHKIFLNGGVCEYISHPIGVSEKSDIYTYSTDVNKCLGIFGQEAVQKGKGGRPCDYDWVEILCMLLVLSDSDKYEIIAEKISGELNQSKTITNIQIIWDEVYPNRKAPGTTVLKNTIMPHIKRFHEINRSNGFSK